MLLSWLKIYGGQITYMKKRYNCERLVIFLSPVILPYNSPEVSGTE